MQEVLAKTGTSAPEAIGIDEISIRKGHTYRIVVSDLPRGRPIWFGGEDRSEASMQQFYNEIGPKKAKKICLAVMDMWKPFRTVRGNSAASSFQPRWLCAGCGIKGGRYTLLSTRENLDLVDGRNALKTLLAANQRLNTAYLLKESFGQLWDYKNETWARKFFECRW